MVTKQHRSPHVGKIHTVSLKLTANFRLVGAMFVYSSLVALCYVDALRYGKFRLAQVIQTTVVTLPVYNRHQEFTVLTVVFLTRPVLEAGLYLSVLTTPPPRPL